MKDVQNVLIAVEWLSVFAFGLFGGLWAVVPMFVLGAALWGCYNLLDPVALGPAGEAAMNAVRILMWAEGGSVLLRFVSRRALIWLLAWLGFTALAAFLILAGTGKGYQAARDAMTCVPLVVLSALWLQDSLMRPFPCGPIARRHFRLMIFSCALVTTMAVTRPLYRSYDTWLLLRWAYIAGTLVVVIGYARLGRHIHKGGFKGQILLTHTI